MSATLRCFTLHAERLEREDVWKRTAGLLSVIERHGGRATLFVHPLTAIEAGADLGPQIREILSRGHEVGQHTHFYAPRDIGADPDATPVTLLSEANVRRCLDRDLAYLREAGADPSGFVAGAWAISDAALGWLREQGFAYDASVRSFALGYDNPDAAAGEGWTSARLEDGLLRLPTTATVTGVARGGESPVVTDAGPYEMTYVHDYDLIQPTRRVAAALVVGRWRPGPWTTAGDLARRIAEPRVDG